MAGFNLMGRIRGLGKRKVTLSGHTSLYQYREDGSTATDAITAGDWRDVPLDTDVHEGITGVSLTAGVVTLPAGTYILRYEAGAYTQTGGAALAAQVRLYDVDGAAEVAGSGGSINESGDTTGNSAAAASPVSRGTVKLTVATETDYKMQIRVSTDAVYSPQSYTSQVCAQLKVTKLS